MKKLKLGKLKTEINETSSLSARPVTDVPGSNKSFFRRECETVSCYSRAMYRADDGAGGLQTLCYTGSRRNFCFSFRDFSWDG